MPVRASLEGMVGAARWAEGLFSVVCVFLGLGALTLTGGTELWDVWRQRQPGECTVTIVIAVLTALAAMPRWRLEKLTPGKLQRQLEQDEAARCRGKASSEGSEDVRGEGDRSFLSRAMAVLERLYEGSWSCLYLLNHGMVSVTPRPAA